MLSAGHSGSTLLSLLLNAHSRIHALSEIDKLGAIVRDPERAARRLASPFWQAVRADYERSTGASFDEIELRVARDASDRASEAALAAWSEQYTALAACVARASGKRVLIDASKDAAQLDALLRAAPLDVRVIELARDGRGVAHSYKRKTGSFAHGLRHWLQSARDADRMRARVPAARWLCIRYEDLARSPERELARACEHLGEPYEPEMLAFRRAAWEGVSGNRIARADGERIELDERWRGEMTWWERGMWGVVVAARPWRAR